MSKPDTWKSWEGQTIDGKFPLRQFLGASDHSAVFLTEGRGTSPQKAAIKLMPSQTSPAADTQLRSLQAKIGLRHSNLLQIFDAGRTQIQGESVVYAVMEFADDNLGQILPQRALEPPEVADLLPPILGALSYLHEKGLVHGRIRPSNILAVGDQLKLSSDPVRSASEPNSGGRRDAFDAPELSAGKLSPASDVWSLAMTMVAALTQKTAFAEQKLQNDPAVPADVPEPYRGIAKASLRLDPSQRASVREIEPRLKQPSSQPAPARVEPAFETTVSPKKRAAFPVTIALAAILAIIFAIFYFTRSKSSGPSADESTSPATTSSAAPQASEPAPSAAKPADTNASVTHQVLPDVPQSARNTISGTIKVVVQTQVDSSGKVTSARLKSPGSSRYFSGLALKAAQEWQFAPPAIDGHPATSTWLVQFRFRRSGTQASAQQAKR